MVAYIWASSSSGYDELLHGLSWGLDYKSESLVGHSNEQQRRQLLSTRQRRRGHVFSVWRGPLTTRPRLRLRGGDHPACTLHGGWGGCLTLLPGPQGPAAPLVRKALRTYSDLENADIATLSAAVPRHVTQCSSYNRTESPTLRCAVHRVPSCAAACGCTCESALMAGAS